MSSRHTFALALIALPFVTDATAGGIAPLNLANLTFAEDISDVPPPPGLARDTMYLTNTETATFLGTVSEVRAFMDQNPITDFVTATEAIPAIEGTEVLSGNWPEPGAVRRVDLAGGHSVHERVLTNTPTSFTYQIWDITAPAGRVVDHIKGEFNFEQRGDSVQVTWDYNIKPNIFIARPAINRYLRDDFGPFMRAGLTGTVNAYARR
ncbi:MAG: SRPBCC family protein [Pseudomonadota bacterium]